VLPILLLAPASWLGCQRGVSGTGQHAVGGPPAPPSSAVSATPASSTPKTPVAVLAEGPARTFRPAPDLIALDDGARFSRTEFEDKALSAGGPRAIRATDEGSLLLVLDDQSPRPLLARTVPLRSVVDEDRELAPGWHTLVAFIQTASEVELSVVHFQIELELPRLDSEAKCALLSPGGTVHTSPSAEVELLAAPLSADVRRLEYFTRDADPLSLAPGLSALARGLPSGDHRLGVRCFDAAGKLIGASERTVTINADARPKGPAP